MLPWRARCAPAFKQLTASQWRHASSPARKTPSLQFGRHRPTPGVGAAAIPSPPLDLFVKLREAGFSDLGSAEALDIARASVNAFQKSTETRSLNLAKDIHPDLRKISAVCSILEFSPRHISVTRWLWEKLALAGDPWALLTQAARLLKTPTNNDQLGIFPKIKVLAERNVWWAMVQYGHYLKQKGQLVNAASWYRKAMDLTKPLTREEIPLPLAGPGIQPWEAYATIQWKIGNLDEAERAAKIGAVEYHSYQGYMILSSILLKKKKCENLEECLTRAAMAHTPETCYRLGEIYRLWHHGREKLEKNGYHGNFLPEDMLPELMSMSSRYYTPDEYYNMAKEWFELASVQGHAMASVQLAVLLREGKMMDKGLKYLDRATDSPKYAEIVTELRELWHQPDADINTTMRKCVGL